MFKFPHESEVCPSGETGEQMEDFDAQSTLLPLVSAFAAARHVKKPMPRMQRWHLAAKCIRGKPCQCRVVLPKGFSSMSVVDAVTRLHQQLGRLEGIDGQRLTLSA